MNNSDQEKKYIDLDSELIFLYKDIEEINKDSSYVKSKHDSFEFLFMGLAGGIIGGMWGNFFHDYFVKIDILWYLSFLSLLGCLFYIFLLNTYCLRQKCLTSAPLII